MEQNKLNKRFIESTINGDLKAVKECLAQDADIETKDKNGNTAFINASFYGFGGANGVDSKNHIKITEYLVKNGAKINFIEYFKGYLKLLKLIRTKSGRKENE